MLEGWGVCRWRKFGGQLEGCGPIAARGWREVGDGSESGESGMVEMRTEHPVFGELVSVSLHISGREICCLHIPCTIGKRDAAGQN